MQATPQNQNSGGQPPSGFNPATLLPANLNLRHYWHIVLERRWLVIATFVSVMVLTGIYLFRSAKIYEASVRLQINKESENYMQMRDVFSADSREQDYMQTQFKNLLSRTLVKRVVDALALEKDPRYSGAQDIIYAVQRDVTVTPIRLSRLVDVKVEHTSPKQAQAIADKLVELFIEQNLESRREASFDALTWLKSQVSDGKADVEKNERALVEYKLTHNQVSLEEGENINRQSLLQASTELTKVKGEAAIAKRAVEEIDHLLAAGQKIDTIPAVSQHENIKRLRQEIAVKEAALAALLKRYRDKYPLVIQARGELEKLHANLAAEAQTILLTMRNNVKILAQQQLEIEELVKAEEQKQFTLNKLKVEYDVLRREAENSKSIYANMLTRLTETDLLNRMNSNNMRVVDPATTPLRPVKPRVVLTILMGMAAAVAASFGLAFFVNYLDDSVKSQDDVENYLRLSFLGYVPNIKTNSVVERDLQAHLHPQSNAAEGFRTIRATISLTHNPDNFRVLSVTSTIPSEGKSLVASNLAIVNAQTGLKTLLVDADLRRPSVHKAFQLHSPTGLAAYLMKQTDNLDDIILDTEVPNLDVVCCGSVPSSPSELVGSVRMREFIRLARERYDRVVMDCPPVSAVSDPLVISAMSDGVVYVTKFNKIRRDHARKSVQRIQNAGIHILGLVVNDIDFEGRDSYYYSYYYYQNRYYSSHYKTGGDSSESGGKEKPVAKV